MSRRDASKDTYEEIELFGKKMLLTTARIDRASVPEGVHLYELRHSDEDWCDPVQIGKGVLVNFYGTVLSRESVELNADGFLDLDADAISYLDSGTVELKDYLAQKPTMQLRAQPLTDADFQMCFSNETLDKTMGVIGHSTAVSLTEWIYQTGDTQIPAIIQAILNTPDLHEAFFRNFLKSLEDSWCED